jgi:hypothetical protein
MDKFLLVHKLTPCLIILKAKGGLLPEAGSSD